MKIKELVAAGCSSDSSQLSINQLLCSLQHTHWMLWIRPNISIQENSAHAYFILTRCPSNVCWYSPTFLATCEPPHREITEEAFPMLLCRNTCRVNCMVYIAATMRGHDKTPLQLNERLPIPNIAIFATPVPLSQLRTRIHTLTSITTKAKLSQIKNVQQRKTLINSRAVCTPRQQHLQEISLEFNGIPIIKTFASLSYFPF